jgi:hypothetical protein
MPIVFFIRDKSPPVSSPKKSDSHAIIKLPKQFFMKKQHLLLIFILLCSFNLQAQKNISQIEINPFIRWDNYPGFTYHYSSRTSSDYLKMEGSSIGISIGYRQTINKAFFVKVGMGYYKYSFQNLDNTNSVFGKSSSARNIDYPSPILILYATDKYHYNTLSINIGVGKQFDLQKGLKLITGLNFTDYYTFSQYYHLTSNPYDGNLNFNKKETSSFGLSVNLSASLVKELGRFQVGPSLILPVYDSWQKDAVFLETDYNGGKNKWLNGIGLGVVCNILLHKKNKS